MKKLAMMILSLLFLVNCDDNKELDAINQKIEKMNEFFISLVEKAPIESWNGDYVVNVGDLSFKISHYELYVHSYKEGSTTLYENHKLALNSEQQNRVNNLYNRVEYHFRVEDAKKEERVLQKYK